ncbi:MAG: NAD-dependent epimerase/dehydratase family protein [Chloroflexi bacterium]|nr:NAD-dependent epimerase/dehydratase family protein [Chloroflexota bacterium]
MKVLVVGGTGPTGPLVVQGLLDRGHEVTMYHRGYHEVAELPEVHRHLHGDPYDRDALRSDVGMEDWDLVLGMYGRLRYLADIMVGRTRKLVGIGGTPSIMQPQHLPFPRGLEFPLPEEHPTYTDRELSSYGFAVADTERRVLAHHERGEYAVVLFRYTGLYGPRVPRNWMWPIVRRVLDGRPHIVIPGDGSQLRPMASVPNAAHQVLLACDRDEGNGQVFYSVDATTYTLRDTIAIITEALGHRWDVVEVSHPLAYDLATGYVSQRGQQLATEKLRTLLGYHDVVEPAQALAEAARWLVEHRGLLDEEQMDDIVGNPYAYDLEDQLIAAFRRWQDEITRTLPAPKLGARTSEFRGSYRPRNTGEGAGAEAPVTES